MNTRIGKQRFGLIKKGKTDYNGGTYGWGTVFKITTTGVLTTLYNFCTIRNSFCADGSAPNGLIQGADGSLYGTTVYGGANLGTGNCSYGCGTVFKITTVGSLTTLYSFCAKTNCTDGYNPYTGLVQASNGNLYGTTYGGGGTGGWGTVFQVTTGGKLTTLHNFAPRPIALTAGPLIHKA